MHWFLTMKQWIHKQLCCPWINIFGIVLWARNMGHNNTHLWQLPKFVPGRVVRGEMQSENIENTNKLFSSSAHLPSPGGRQWIQLKGGKGQIEKLCKTFKLKIFRAWVLLQNIILVIGELQELFCIICQNKWFYFL